jgi:ribosomal protein S12 methylthiotransferase
VFAYSKEDGTRAGAMTGQIPDKVKQQRRKLAMAAQHKIARQVSESFVGRTLKVLVEGRANEEQLRQANVSSWEHGLVREAETLNPSAFASGYGATAPKRSEGGQPSTLNYLIARSEADAPDIDGRVYVLGKLPIGEFARVKIVGHTDYDLIAEPV